VSSSRQPLHCGAEPWVLLSRAAVASKLAAPSLELVETKRRYAEVVLQALVRQKFCGSSPQLQHVILRQARH